MSDHVGLPWTQTTVSGGGPPGRRRVQRVDPSRPVASSPRRARPGRLDTEPLEPPRIERGRREAHQMISATLALRPEPMPMQSTRSPA